MSLPDQHSGVVYTLRQAQLVDTRLQTTFQEVLNLKREHVVQPHARLVQHADAHKTSNERIAFEQPLRVFLIKGEQLTNSARQPPRTIPDLIRPASWGQ